MRLIVSRIVPVCAGLAALSLSAAASWAGDVSERSAITITFESLDKNADQQISRTEAAGEKSLADNFAFVDTDGDGYVNKAEYTARTQS